jgi:COP9 signalosome complex subunit 2
MKEWTEAIGSLYRTVFSDGDGFKTQDINSSNDGESIVLPGLQMGRAGQHWGGGHGKGKGVGKGKKGGGVFGLPMFS